MNAADVLGRGLALEYLDRAFGVDTYGALRGAAQRDARKQPPGRSADPRRVGGASRRALGLWASEDDLEATWIDGYRLNGDLRS